MTLENPPFEAVFSYCKWGGWVFQCLVFGGGYTQFKAGSLEIPMIPMNPSGGLCDIPTTLASGRGHLSSTLVWDTQGKAMAKMERI